jgi:hypothetical protein
MYNVRQHVYLSGYVFIIVYYISYIEYGFECRLYIYRTNILHNLCGIFNAVPVVYDYDKIKVVGPMIVLYQYFPNMVKDYWISFFDHNAR